MNSFLKLFIKNKGLILSLTKRDVLVKYKGSTIGVLWSVINPILMMVIYTFVFSMVFKVRWGDSAVDSRGIFALALFIGLIFFGLFSECINKAPFLITSNANYVKKIVFPIEILPVVALGSALFQMIINFGVWLVFYILIIGVPKIQFLWIPIIIFPFLLNIIGITLVLSSLGVYLKDIGQFVNIVVTVLMYLSPVFYPTSMLPENYRIFMQLSPVTYVIEQARACMLDGSNIDIISWLYYTLFSLIVLFLGYKWFSFTKKGFSDVI